MLIRKSKINHTLMYDSAQEKIYCICEGGKCYSSKDGYSYKVEKASLPDDLCKPAAISTKNEYRLYSVCADGIKLYVSKSPLSNYRLRDFIAIPKNNDIALSNPSIFNDPKSHSHFLIYGESKKGINIIPINPRNGLSLVEDNGINIASCPQFNNFISDGTIVYNKDSDYYYLFATYGDSKYGSIRVGRSSNVFGPYTDYNGRDLTDTNDFDGIIGFMPLASYQFDELAVYNGFSRPRIVSASDKDDYSIMYSGYSDETHTYSQCISSLLFYNEWPLILPAECLIESIADNSSDNVAGNYEYVLFKKSFPLTTASYTRLTILRMNENGVSSTKNSWAESIPPESYGRIEIGGSLRGSWSISHDKCLSITINHTVLKCCSIKAKCTIQKKEIQLNLLCGYDNNGYAFIAKKY